MNTNDNCDGAGPHTEGEVRSLPIGHGNAILCRACFGREMTWRQRHDVPGGTWIKFDILSWADLGVYPKPSPADVAQEQARMRRRNAKTIGL